MHLKNYKSIKITQNYLNKLIKNAYNSVMECITIWDVYSRLVLAAW